MKTRTSLFSSLIMLGMLSTLGAVACSSGNGERHASTEQRIETTPDAADGDASAGDGSTSATDIDAGNTCMHSLCATGPGLAAACDPCAATLCAADPYCCASAWDATCVGEVATVCSQSCTAMPPAGADAGPTTCPHSPCATGVALPSTCEACATQVCAQDLYCCTAAWDATCVGEVSSICGKTCQ